MAREQQRRRRGGKQRSRLETPARPPVGRVFLECTAAQVSRGGQAVHGPDGEPTDWLTFKREPNFKDLREAKVGSDSVEEMDAQHTLLQRITGYSGNQLDRIHSGDIIALQPVLADLMDGQGLPSWAQGPDAPGVPPEAEDGDPPTEEELDAAAAELEDSEGN